MDPLTLLAGGALVAGGMLLFGRGRGRARRGGGVCAMTPAQVAASATVDVRAWVVCDGRTVGDVSALARIYRSARRDDDATYVEGVWNVEGGRGVSGSDADAIAHRVAGSLPASTSVLAPDADAARRMVGAVTAALRRRTDYRRVLAVYQAAAGLPATGEYDGRTQNALAYHGGQPPRAWRAPAASEPRAAYPVAS